MSTSRRVRRRRILATTMAAGALAPVAVLGLTTSSGAQGLPDTSHIHRVHWAGGSAGPATINPPVCDSSFHCVSSFSFGQGAPTHGDLVGTFVVAGGGSLVGDTIQISSV